MTWHSAARATSGGKMIRVGAISGDITVLVVPRVPLDQKRVIGMTHFDGVESFYPFSPFNGQMTFLKGINNGVDGSLVNFNWFLVDAEGVRFPIKETLSVEPPPAAPNEAVFGNEEMIILDEGESIEVDLSAGAVPGGKVDLFAQWVDPQGTLKINRVVLTTDYQDIIPSPDEGNVHVPFLPLVTRAAAENFSYTLLEDGGTGGGINVARVKDGSTLTSVATAATAAVNSVAGLGVPNPAFAPALSRGESLRAKLDAFTAGKKILVVPYLVITEY